MFHGQSPDGLGLPIEQIRDKIIPQHDSSARLQSRRALTSLLRGNPLSAPRRKWGASPGCRIVENRVMRARRLPILRVDRATDCVSEVARSYSGLMQTLSGLI